MRVVAIIPARHGSTRLPGKPLLAETGRYLVQHAWERTRESSRVDRVVVATDDDRIVEAVRSFGGVAVRTDPGHASGTDRVAEAAADLEADVVLNVQGDEPEIHPADLDRLAGLLDDPAVEMGTLAAPAGAGQLASPHVVKVVCDRGGRALYFSRAPIPHVRGEATAEALRHLGVYAFRRAFLLEFARLEPTPLERTEGLEQLRALEHGHRIRVARAEHPAEGIDTREEYDAFVARWRARGDER